MLHSVSDTSQALTAPLMHCTHGLPSHFSNLRQILQLYSYQHKDLIIHKERKCDTEIFINTANFLAEGNMHSQSYAVSFVY